MSHLKYNNGADSSDNGLAWWHWATWAALTSSLGLDVNKVRRAQSGPKPT